MCHSKMRMPVPIIRYRPDVGLLTSEPAKHDVELNPRIIAPDPFTSDDCLDVFSSDHQLLPTPIEDENTMSTGEDELSSGLNGRLRPRKSTVLSPQNTKFLRKSESKNAQDKPKRTSTPSKASTTKADDLVNKSDISIALQLLCPYCDKKFASKQALSKHVRRIHLSSSKQDTFFGCLYCNHGAADTNDIIRHMVDSHPNQYFACLDCHARFPSTSELAEHKLNVCEKQKMSYRSKLRQKSMAKKKNDKSVDKFNKEFKSDDKVYSDSHRFNGIVISCELKPSHVTDEADIEDNITTNLILPPSKSLGTNAVIEKNAVIVLDDIQWNKRMPTNFSFHNTDADQILSRLGVVHRSPRTGESTKRDWLKTIEDSTQKFERCFDTSFYSKVASNVQENLTKFLDGSFNFNPDAENTIKTRKLKNSVVINTAEGFPILLAFEQYSRNAFDSYLPRTIAPKHKWKWENDRSLMNPADIKRDSHVNNCIITLVSGLDIWTQLSMRRKFEDKFGIAPLEKKTEKQNAVSKELKEILESREIPTTSSSVVKYTNKVIPARDIPDFPASLGLTPSVSSYEIPPAVLSGEWVRPRCYVCCACGAQTRDSRGLSSHISTQHPNAQVQHYEIVGELLLNADILKHLYVPPSQLSNRTRPLRGIRECTKCKKPISLEDLHQHMLDCAGDTPAVRRKCRYRPFGVRRRRPRLPDNTIRKKIRKDIRRQTRQTRQKCHMRSRPKIRSEVGDAETIRKMLADLPAKRHRVMVTPTNSALRPRKKLDKQRNKLIMKRRRNVSSKSRQQQDSNRTENNDILPSASIEEKDENKLNTSTNNDDEDDKPLLRTRIKRVLNNSTRQQVSMKRKVVLNRAKRRAQFKEQSEAKDNDNHSSTNAQSEISKGQTEQLSVGNTPQKIDVTNSPYNTRENSSRNRSNNNNNNNNNDQRPGCSGQNGNRNNSLIPVQNNVPLKHSIARLTADTEIHDKSLQFQNMYLLQRGSNNATQHEPVGLRPMFESEAIVTKLDKPPLHFQPRGLIDPFSFHKNKLNKPRKGLNDCIAMLKNKLVEPYSILKPGQLDQSARPLISESAMTDLIPSNTEYEMESKPAEVFSRHQYIQERLCEIDTQNKQIREKIADFPLPYMPEQRAFHVMRHDKNVAKTAQHYIRKKRRSSRASSEKDILHKRYDLPPHIELIPQKSIESYPVTVTTPSHILNQLVIMNPNIDAYKYNNYELLGQNYLPNIHIQEQRIDKNQMHLNPLDILPKSKCSPTETNMSGHKPPESYRTSQRNNSKPNDIYIEREYNKVIPENFPDREVPRIIQQQFHPEIEISKRATSVSSPPFAHASVSPAPPAHARVSPVSLAHAGVSPPPPAHTSVSPVSLPHTGDSPPPPAHARVSPVARSSVSPISLSHAGVSPVSLSRAGVSPVSLAHTSISPVSLGHASVSTVSLDHLGVSPNSLAHTDVSRPPPAHSGVSPVSLACAGVSLVSPAHAGDSPPPPAHAGALPVSLAHASVSLVSLAHSGVSPPPPAHTGVSPVSLARAGDSPPPTAYPSVSPQPLVISGVFTPPLARAGVASVSLTHSSVSSKSLAHANASPPPPAHTGVLPVSLAQAGASPPPPAHAGVSPVSLAHAGVSPVLPAHVSGSSSTIAHAGVSPPPKASNSNKLKPILPVPLDLSINMTDNSDLSSKQNSSYDTRDYVRYETLDLSNKSTEQMTEEVNNDGIVDLTLKINSQSKELGQKNDLKNVTHLPGNTIVVDIVPTDLSIKNKTDNIDHSTYESQDSNYVCARDISRMKNKKGDTTDRENSITDIMEEEAPTDLSGRNIRNMSPTISNLIKQDMYNRPISHETVQEEGQRFTDYSEKKDDEIQTETIIQEKEENIACEEDYNVNDAYNTMRHDEDDGRDLSLIDQESQLIHEHKIDVEHRESSMKLIKPIENSVTTAAAILIDAIPSSHGNKLPSLINVNNSAQLKPFVSSVEKFEKLSVCPTVCSLSGPIPLYTLSNPLPTSKTKHESTTPVYTLANACISMTKVEPTNTSQNLDDPILSIPSTTIASTQPMYTLKDTTVKSAENYIPTLNNEPQDPPNILDVPDDNEKFNVIDNTVSIDSISNTQMTSSKLSKSSAPIQPIESHLQKKEKSTNDVDMDPETAKKIAMLPKELVEILGTMPVDHRNQLLNVLPHYVSKSPMVHAKEISNTAISTHTLTDTSLRYSTVSSHTLSIEQEIKPLAILQKNSELPVSSENNYINAAKMSLSVSETEQNRIIDLTEDDLNVKPPEEFSNNLTIPIEPTETKSNKIKVKEQTASLRAVRIKAPSERKKSVCSDHQPIKTTTEQLSQENTQVDNKHEDNNELTDFNKTLAIQQAEVSSTQHNTTVLGHSKYPLAISPASTESSSDESSKNINHKNLANVSQLAAKHSQINDIPVSKTINISTSLISIETKGVNTTENDGRINLQNLSKPSVDKIGKVCLMNKNESSNETNDIECKSEISKPKLIEIEDIVQQEDSEDDVSLAVIVKQKQRDLENNDYLKDHQNIEVLKKKKDKGKNNKKHKKSNKKRAQNSIVNNAASECAPDVLSFVSDPIFLKGDGQKSETLGQNTDLNVITPFDSSSSLKNASDFDTYSKKKAKKNRRRQNEMYNGKLIKEKEQHESNNRTDYVTLDLNTAHNEDTQSNEIDRNESLPGNCPSVKYVNNIDSPDLGLQKFKENLDITSNVQVKLNKVDDKYLTMDLVDDSKIDKNKMKQINKEETKLMQPQPNSLISNYSQKAYDTTSLHSQPTNDESLCGKVENRTLDDTNSLADHLKNETKSVRSKKVKPVDGNTYNQDSNLAQELSAKDSNGTPLRRSRRGKSLFMESTFVDKETPNCSEIPVEHKTPLTKKQLIFSKLLLDEAKPLIPAHSTPERQDNTENMMVTSAVSHYEISNKSDTEIEKCDQSKGTKRSLSPHNDKKYKKKKSVLEYANITDKIGDNSYTGSEVVPKDISTPNNTCTTVAYHDMNIEDYDNVVRIKSLMPHDKDFTDNRLKQTCFIEKRKIYNHTSSDVEQNSKPKKSKLCDDSNLTKEDNDKKLQIENTVSIPSSETRTACYNLPVPAKRGRSKSVLVKSSVTDNYDPYDIDLEDMIERHESFRRTDKNSDYGSSHKRGKHNSSATKQNIKILKVKDKTRPIESTLNEVVNKPILSDSDESSKSDTPLQKYVEEKGKKITEVKTNSDKQKRNVSNSTSNNSTKFVSGDKNNKAQNDAEQELRSEQFMESFGFFCERKPRKSNLLASKKISETFHTNNESDDMYFGFKQRSSKKSTQNDSKKIAETEILKSSQQANTTKTSQQVNTSKAFQQASTSKVVQQVISPKVLQQDNTSKTSHHANTSKASQQANTSKASHQANTSKVLQQAKTSKVLQQVNTSKVSQQANTLKVLQQVNTSKVLQQVNTPKTSQQSKKAAKRGRKKKSCTKTLPSYCDVCKKEFRRSDNYVRHSMTLLHISKWSEAEMKVKTAPVHEEPNYLVAYKLYLERFTKLTDKLAKLKKRNPKAAAKIVLPTMKDLLSDLNRTVREQQLSQRALSRDEELFIDCCELLKESHRGIAGISGDSLAMSGLDLLEKAINENFLSEYESDDDDVDSITAKNIMESEEVRNLENDLISTFKEAANANRKPNNNDYQRSVPKITASDDLIDNFSSPNMSNRQYQDKEEFDIPEKNKPNKTKKHSVTKEVIQIKEMMYPDIIEDIDMLEDKFDKIKRKCRSQAAAAKQMQPVIDQSARNKARRKAEKKKGKRISKKIRYQNTQVPTKGALKGFDGIKVSIPTSDINISALVPVSEYASKKKKKTSSKKKREKNDSESSSKYDSDNRIKEGSSSIDKKVDVYEFMDNEDAELFEFRPSTLMERFKSISNKDGPSTSKLEPSTSKVEGSTSKVEASTSKIEPSTSKVEPRSSKVEPSTSKVEPSISKVEPSISKVEPSISKVKPSTSKVELGTSKVEPNTSKIEPSRSKVEPVADDSSSGSGSDNSDDFVYMSDDYVCSDNETENSVLSCENGNVKVGHETKKNVSPQKRKDVVEKNAVMGKIFKNNAVRAGKKTPVPKEPNKPKANYDQIFDSLLEEKSNNSPEDNDSLEKTPKSDKETKRALPLSRTSLTKILDKKLSDDDKFTSSSRSKSPNRNDKPLLLSLKRRSPSSKDSQRTDILTKKFDDTEDYGASTSKKHDSGNISSYIDFGPSTSKKYEEMFPKDLPPKRNNAMSSKKEKEFISPHYDTKLQMRGDTTTSKPDEILKSYEDTKSPEKKPDEDVSTSCDYTETSELSAFEDETGVARQRARRKCTVGKQNVLVESWSSESEPDGGPPRPNSAESDIAGGGRKKKGKKKESQQAGGRRGNNRQVTFKRIENESRVNSNNRNPPGSSSGSGYNGGVVDPGEGTSAGPSGSQASNAAADAAAAAAAASAAMPAPSTAGAPGTAAQKGRTRSVAYYWSSEGDDEQEHQQQHGWIVGDSHKKLVTMLAHAKGRKRNNDDKRHLIE